jgi:transcriptional regulator with XRE-family HTH domain
MKTLKVYRELKGLSQKQLADKAGISNLTVGNIESQANEPGDDTRYKLENSLGQRINWLETCGLKVVSNISWEQAESSMRSAVLLANGLTQFERTQFFIVAKEYINTMQRMIAEKEIDDDEVLYPLGITVSNKTEEL